MGISDSQFGRCELDGLTIEQLALAAGGVGLRPRIRLYPDDDPIRDIAHARLLERFGRRLAPGIRWRLEVPISASPDRRAWDANLSVADEIDALEAETRVRDGQALWRKVQLKRGDDPRVRFVIILVADTHANRGAIAAVRESLRDELPLDGRTILHRLGRGESPGGSGIVFL
jgi:hypothetical protein